MSLTLRGIKGSALTHGELDNNFIWLSSRDIVAAVIDSNSNLILTKEDSSYYSVPLSGVNTYISGLTFSGNVLTITQSDGVSVSVNISSVDIRVTDLVYSADTLILYQSDGSSETVLIPQFSGGTINGPTNFTNGLSANTFNTTSLTLNGVTITGFTSYDYTFTGGTVTGPTNFTNGLSANTINTTSLILNGVSLTAITDTFVTGFTYNGNNTFIISQNQGQPDLTATINSVTGLTVNGNLVVTGNTALQSLSATSVNTNSLTLNNVTITGFTSYDYVFTGGTVTGPTNFINGLSATSVNTNSLIVNGITYTAITDTFVTGFTYNDANRLTISRNQGQSDLNVFINTFSGLTVNGTALINGDVNILGNVNVIGTATTLNTQVVQTRDNKILLNYSGTNLTAIGGGIEVLSAKTDGTNVSLTTDINGDWNSNTGFIISGRTSDSTTNGLKVVNSSGTNNLVVRNDGKVGINTSNPNYQLEVLPKDLTGTTQVVIRNTSTSPNWTPVGLYVQDGSGYGVSMSNSSNGQDAVLTINSGVYSYLNHSANGALVSSLLTAGDYLLWRLPDTFDFRRRVTNNTWLRFDSLNQNLSIFNETNSPPSINSRLGVRGSDSSSSNYGLKVQDSGGTNNFVVRNDGNVGIGTSAPSEKLEVSGKTKTTTLQVTNGATTGYVLTATDTNGNMSWQTPTLFNGGTVTGPTNFTGGLTANTFNTTSLTLNGVTLTAITDTFVTGFTYNNANKLTISQNQGKSNIDVFINTFSGLTINGNLVVTGNTTLQSLSATSVNTNSLTLNNVILTAITDTFTTGFTYDNNNKLTISRNQGQPDLNIFINTMSGLTVNGPLTVTGTTELKGVIKNTGSRLVFGTGLDPETDRSQTLGTSTKSWGNVYTELLTLEDSSGADQVILSIANQTVPGDIALEWELPPTTGSVGTLLGVWNLNGTKSKSTWFTISAGTNINLNQQIFSGGSVITINSTAFGGTFTGGTISGPTNFTNGLTANSVNTTSLTLNGLTITGFTTYVFTGNTSASCITDLYVKNLHGCSPINIWNQIQYNTSSALTQYSSALGFETTALGEYSNTEGYRSNALTDYSHAEGKDTFAGWKGFSVSAIINNSTIVLDSSYGDVTGEFTSGGLFTTDTNQTYVGYNNLLTVYEGGNTKITLLPQYTGITFSPSAVADEDNLNSPKANVLNPLGGSSHAEGQNTKAYGGWSHAEGFGSIAGDTAHAEGGNTFAPGTWSHAEGNGTVASGESSHSEGDNTVASGKHSHAEGSLTKAAGLVSHAEGYGTVASGSYSHSQGYNTIASGTSSHAGGYLTNANGNYSFVHGTGSTATASSSIVLGNNLTGTSYNTVYVPNLNIKNVGSSTSLYNLGIDVNGNVVAGTTGSGTFTGGTVSGATTFTSQVTANGGLTTNGGLTANAGLTATSVNTGSVSTSSLNLNGTIIISITDNYVTGGTINSSGTLTLNRQNGSVTISGFTTGTTFNGGTVTGPTNFTGGLTANTLTVGTFSVSRKFSSSESFTGSVTKTVTHNLNTQDVIVQLWDSSNNLLNGATIVANTVNSVDITVASTATYKVVIIG